MLSTCVPGGGEFCACCAASVRHLGLSFRVRVRSYMGAVRTWLSPDSDPRGCWVRFSASVFSSVRCQHLFLEGTWNAGLPLLPRGRPRGRSGAGLGGSSITRRVSSPRLAGPLRSCCRSQVSRLPPWEPSCLLSSTKGRGIKGCGEEGVAGGEGGVGSCRGLRGIQCVSKVMARPGVDPVSRPSSAPSPGEAPRGLAWAVASPPRRTGSAWQWLLGSDSPSFHPEVSAGTEPCC